MAIDLDGRVNYGHLFSIELPKTAISMDVNLTQGTSCLSPSKIVQAVSKMISEARAVDVFKSDNLRYLRNIAFPADLDERSIPNFDTKSELGRILPAMRNRSLAFSFYCNGYALRNRFKGLPIHRVCYYHSYDPEAVAVGELTNELSRSIAKQRQQDCIGMTPLHILACCTKHRIGMYSLLIEKCPEQLITEDHWGDIPLFYAIWGNAPREIVCLLSDCMKNLYPNYKLDWGKMVDTLVRAMAPSSCLVYLIKTCQHEFRSGSDLESIDWALMVGEMAKERASEGRVNEFINTYGAFFPRNDTDLESMACQLVRHEKFGFQTFWLKIGIAERLASLEKQEWRNELETMIQSCPTGSSGRCHRKRIEVMEAVHWKLKVYEVYGMAWLLELAAWKARMESCATGTNHGESRPECRFTCGAPIIVHKVVAFLLPQKIMVNDPVS